MIEARHGHGCGFFYKENTKVNSVIIKLIRLPGIKKVLLVAGGFVSCCWTKVASTEILLKGSTAWTQATPLPTAQALLASVSFGNKIYLLGKCKCIHS